jgi:beta-glucosidase
MTEQEPILVPESFYFFKAKIEHRFTHKMVAGRTYTLSLESWAIIPKVLANAKGRVFQGSALRFFEYVDIPGSIANATAAAERSDLAVVFVGTTNEIESEGYDRDTMDLPGQQYELIRAVAAKNPRTVVVNFSGAPVDMTPFFDQVAAIVQGGFPGQECGHSIAQVLVGKVNPGR